ncbi:MAG: NlpC/P60 family protein [Streptosporangiaceae bacterium]
MAVGLAVALSLLATPVVPAAAEPKPSRKELTAKEKKLVDQLEVLTEQHNGLVVRLEQSQRAAKAAKGTSARAQLKLDDARTAVARLAAERYKNSGLDTGMAMAVSADPQSLLDRYSAVGFLAAQSDTRITGLMTALQSAARTRKASDDRIDQVKRLTKESDDKRKKIQGLLKSVRDKLGKPPTSPKDPPPVVDQGQASQKAMGAVKAALAQLGVPYSWGGGNASGPSYGTDQGANIKGFDCSGLTLYAYAQVGINLPHYTGDQWNSGARLGRSNLRPGDLVFFYGDLHHMGMYIGNGKMIHAPQTGDVVRISSIDGRPFAGGVRVA